MSAAKRKITPWARLSLGALPFLLLVLLYAVGSHVRRAVNPADKLLPSFDTMAQWPRLFTAVRLGLVPAWIFLISAEAIASTGGLGYRIFLVRRYLAMDVILPYVAWITLLAYALDRTFQMLSRRLFRWAHLEGESL
jgi:hypothetical protein